MLLGMLFAFVYGALDNLGGEPFFTDGHPGDGVALPVLQLHDADHGRLRDLTARTDLGHTLAVFEALIGQIYLVTVVSLIVSNLGRARPNRS